MTTSGIGIETSVNEIEAFCKKWDIVEMSLFGSVLRDDFSPASDIDVLVTFSDEARHGLFAMARMRNGLEDVLQRKVDLVSRRAVERSRNSIRREAILGSARVIYATG
ncbi:MAG: nucleotidyltransferase [Chloroflexi bacterium]|nr:nucleotidyltransferase [Chloroflexota bacterium]